MNGIHKADYEKNYHRAIEAYGENMQVNVKNEVNEIIHQKMDRLEKRLESGI